MPMKYKLGDTSRKNLATVEPELQRVVERAIQITEQDFMVHMGARSAAEQNALYQIGRTKPGKIVTSKDGYKNKSNHQVDPRTGFGRSVDLVPWENGKLDWDWELIWPIAVAMSKAAHELRTEIRWGGNWYENMSQYGHTEQAVRDAVERYKREHPGPDMIDGPHFELV